MAEPVTLFCHIPKTAGSTLQQIIREQYSPREILSLYHRPRNEVLNQVNPLPEHVRIIAGHVRAGFSRFVSRPSRRITVLRDPVDCALSFYYYVRRMPTHPLHQGVVSGELSLLDIARKLANRQTLYVSGRIKDDGPVPDEELLLLAKENLVKGFAAFGLMECFDETVILFNRVLNWRVGSYITQNVTTSRPTREQTDPKLLDSVREMLGADIELYAFAKEKFDRLLEVQGPDFSLEVEHLRENNRNPSLLRRLSQLFTLRRA